MSSTSSEKLKETDLYPEIKALFERQGYQVKGEVGAADVVARRGTEDPVIVELKVGFSMALIHQAIERQAITDFVYIAIARGKGKRFQKSLKQNIALCQRLGIGLITVRMRDQFAEVHLDPAPYTPRKIPRRKAKLLREFDRRVGDPNPGGSAKRTLMTAYRQDAIRCAMYLNDNGATKAAVVAKSTANSKARAMMANDHYGWFQRVDRGVYDITKAGVAALAKYSDEVVRLSSSSIQQD